MDDRISDLTVMDNNGTYKHLRLATWLTILLFISGRVAGDSLGANTWSFTHWHHLSRIYLIGWGLGAVLLAIVLGRFLPALAAFFESRRNAFVGGLLLLVIVWGLQYDSFLYAGGNLRIAQIAQTEDVIFPWYEYGTVFVAWLLDQFWSLFGLHYNTAGVYAWRTLSFLCAGLSLIAAWRIAKILSADATRRLGLFLILFFGPQLIVYLGYVGVGPVIAAMALWVAYGMALLATQATLRRAGFLWGIFALGIVLHVATLFLLPAVIAVTIGAIAPRLRTGIAPFVAGGLVLTGLTAGLYAVAGDYLLLKSGLLLTDGKPPHGNYALFSERHLTDFGQVLFLLFPLVIVALYLLFRRLPSALTNPLPAGALLMALGGLISALVMDPIHSVVLDLPRYAPFLAPGAFLLVVLLRERPGSGGLSPSVLGLIAAASIILPAGYLPVYTRIDTAESYVTGYLDRHNAYYRTAAVALRDAYFYRKDMDPANYWDQAYQRKSPDYLNLTGIEDFILTKRLDIALPSLNKLIARNPYWAEPRALFGRVMVEQRRFELAKPQLDTALLLEPYNPEHRRNLYAYYRERGEFTEALERARRASALFPNNEEIRIDLMIINFRAGNAARAEELADRLLQEDSTRAYPHAIKGFLAEGKGNLRNAMAYFEKFCELAPEAPETPQIRKRSNDLYLKLNGNTAKQP